MQSQPSFSPASVPKTPPTYIQSVEDRPCGTLFELTPPLRNTAVDGIGQVSSENIQGESLKDKPFRCPVCDEGHFTLEVLSAHMLENGHGRFGTVDATMRHRRVFYAPAIPLASVNSTNVFVTSSLTHCTRSKSRNTTNADAPSMAVPPVATTPRVSTSGTASAVAAAHSISQSSHGPATLPSTIVADRVRGQGEPLRVNQDSVLGSTDSSQKECRYVTMCS